MIKTQYAITYSTITSESVLDGDTNETGFYIEHTPITSGSIRAIVNFMECHADRDGIELSSSHIDKRCWFSVVTEDMDTCNQYAGGTISVQYCLHFKNVTLSSLKRIARILCVKYSG